MYCDDCGNHEDRCTCLDFYDSELVELPVQDGPHRYCDCEDYPCCRH